jgi:Right handed beta helix region/Fibronectin type III domain
MKACVLLLALPMLLLLTACPTSLAPSGNLAVPTGLTTTPGDGQVNLVWQASAEKDVAQYVVKLESQGDLSGEIVVTAPATGTTIKQLANDKNYTFSLAIETSAKKRSAFSETVTATPKSPLPTGGGGTPSVAAPTGLTLVTGDASITATWNANPEADLKGYTLFWGTTPDALTQSKALDAPTTTKVEGLTNGTTYFFALEAQNTNLEKSAHSTIETATPAAVITQPVIESVAIEGYGSSLQVRQGAFFILKVSGQNLSNLSSATLGTLPANILPTTGSDVVLAFTMPHGQTPGFLTLSLTTGNGTTTKTNAIEVTEISVQKSDKFKPSDANPGTKERPFLTLTKALSVAAPGDTVLLGAGEYKEGESWSPNTGLSPNVPDGVTIIGIAQNKVFLEGPGSETTTAALSFAGSATVRNLTISNFSFGLLYVLPAGEQGYGGSISLENLTVSGNYAGMYAYGPSNVTVSNSSFVFNALPSGGVGLQLSNFGDATVQNTTFTGNTYGIYATSARSLLLRDVTVEQSDRDGLYLEDIYSSELNRGKVIDNKGNGIFASSFPQLDMSFTMEFSEVSNNEKNGVLIAGSKDAIWDLGSYTNGGGNNTLAGNTEWQLLDDRDAGTGVTIKAEGNIIGDSFIIPGTYTATTDAGQEQQLNGVKLWRTNRKGNSVAF